jgi:hypothetical protein
MASCRLVAIIMSMGPRGRVGLVTPSPMGRAAIYRLCLEAHFTCNWGRGFVLGGGWRLEATRLEAVAPCIAPNGFV